MILGKSVDNKKSQTQVAYPQIWFLTARLNVVLMYIAIKKVVKEELGKHFLSTSLNDDEDKSYNE